MISPNDTILIAGDSWACGEWTIEDGSWAVTHRGLEHFLIEYGCKVHNVGMGGASNKDAVGYLTESLETIKPDVILWFQTDPIRDLRPYPADSFPRTVDELYTIQEQLLNSIYAELNELGVAIHCMGGVFKLNEHLLANYDKLIPIIPSIIELFGVPAITCWISDWIQYDHLKLSYEFLRELEQINPMYPNPTDRLCRYGLPEVWFFPDGLHPNRAAHREIFEYILKHHK